ncbi:MAG: omptin family outer membrane protease [Treponema sp.]|nr:omptin family outer membrane protease [Treponema sp.]
MIKKFFLLVLIFSFHSAFAETVFSLRPSFSFYTGQQSEYVFCKYTDANENLEQAKLSELDWEQKALLLFGLDFFWKTKHVVWSSGFKFAVPVYSGLMVDSDWKNVVFLPAVPLDKASIKTNYTESKNKTNFVLELGGGFSYNIVDWPNFTLSAFLDFDYTYNSMAAWGLYGKYNDKTKDSDGFYRAWNDVGGRTVNYPESQKTVGLDRHWAILWLGLGMSGADENKVAFDFSFAVSPFAFAASIDNHYERSLVFVDLLYGFFNAGKIAVSLGCNVTEKSSLKIFADFRGSLVMKGVSYIGYAGENDFALDTVDVPGADFKSIEAGISYTHRF